MSATRRATVVKSWAATRAAERIGVTSRRKQLRMIGTEVATRRTRLAGGARAAVEVAAAQLGERRKDEINRGRRREGIGMRRRAGRRTGVTHTTRALTRAQRNTRAVTEQPHFVILK